MTARRNCLALVVCAGLAAGADARPDTPEVEPNQPKATATAVTLAAGDTVSGSTTGTSTSAAGVGSADYYRIKTSAAPLAIYRQRLELRSTTLFQTATIRGLSQTALGIGGTTDITFQTGSTTPVAGARTVVWYGFGKEEEVYYRVTGTTTSTATYASTFQRDVVTPVDFTALIYAGNVRIGPAAGNTVDLDWWLYDDNLNPISCAGMDGGPTPPGTGVRDVVLTPGTYYLAAGRYNSANNLPSCAPDDFFTGNVADFPNVFMTSSTTVGGVRDMSFTSTAGEFSTSGVTTTAAFEVPWIKFTVVPAPTVFGSGGATPAAAVQGTSTEFKVTVYPGGAGTLADIANPPQPSGVRVDVAQVSGNSSPDWLYLARDGATADWKLTYPVPASTPFGPYGLPLEVTQGGVAPSTFAGSVAMSVVPPQPANDFCSGAIDITTTPYTSPLVDYYSATTDPSANPSCDSTSNTTGANRGVWWKYTAATTGVLVVNRNSSTGEDTVTSSWSGPDCSTLAAGVCENLDVSAFYVPVVSGSTYYIMVSRFAATVPAPNGQVGISVEFFVPPPPPANDLCSAAEVITTLPYTAPALIPIDFATDDVAVLADGTCNSSTTVLRGLWFKHATGATGGTFTVREASSLDSVMAIFSSTSDCSALTFLGCTDGEPFSGDEFYYPVASPNTTYYFLVGKWGPLAPTPGSVVDFSLDLTPPAPPPANDACASAELISTLPYTSADINVTGATPDANVSCNTGGATQVNNGIWFTHTPAADTTVLLSELGSLDSITAVYTGTCDALVQAGCYGSEGLSVVNLTGGTTYSFLVGIQGLNAPGPAGSISFRVALPLANDMCANATVLSTFPFNETTSTGTATNDGPFAPQGTCNYTSTNVGIQNSVWYRFAPASNGTLGYVINPDVNAPGYDAVIVIYSGASCSGLTELACGNTPEPITGTQAVSVGTVYYICLGDQGSFAGGGVTDVSFTFTPDVPSADNCCRGTTCNAVASGTCTGTIAGSVSLVVTSCGGGNAFASCCYADFNHDGTQSIDDLFLYFNAYFTSSPMADFGGDGTSQPTIDDLFLYINAYFGTCS